MFEIQRALFPTALSAMFCATAIASQNDTRISGALVEIIVTVEAKKGAMPAQITRDDVMVFENGQRRPVTNWSPIEKGGSLELWVLIDDGLETSLGTQLEDLRKFVAAQPPTTEVAIGYLRNGSVSVAQSLTEDHESAAKTIRLPTGVPGVSASPYISLARQIDEWPNTTKPREVLMITSGIDPYYGPGPQDPYLSEAIDKAQRAHVVVNSIYFASAGHLGHSYWQITWGQNNLSQLDEETGGEFYWQGFSNAVSFGPFLDDLTSRIQHQYLLAFVAAQQPKAGFQKIRLATEVPFVTLCGPSRVYIPAAQ